MLPTYTYPADCDPPTINGVDCDIDDLEVGTEVSICAIDDAAPLTAKLAGTRNAGAGVMVLILARIKFPAAVRPPCGDQPEFLHSLAA